MNEEEIRQQWVDRTGAYSPTYYAHYGPNDVSDTLRRHLTEHPGPDASVLEVGCSAGRHLAHLQAAGFDDLIGVELNPAAAHVMHREYPDLATACTLYIEAIESVIDRFDDAAFGAVYTVETLQHLPPASDWVFAAIARITDQRLITIETEAEDGTATEIDGVPLFYRDYRAIFTRLGLDHVETEGVRRGTLHVFEP